MTPLSQWPPGSPWTRLPSPRLNSSKQILTRSLAASLITKSKVNSQTSVRLKLLKEAGAVNSLFVFEPMLSLLFWDARSFGVEVPTAHSLHSMRIGCSSHASFHVLTVMWHIASTTCDVKQIYLEQFGFCSESYSWYYVWQITYSLWISFIPTILRVKMTVLLTYRVYIKLLWWELWYWRSQNNKICLLPSNVLSHLTS